MSEIDDFSGFPLHSTRSMKRPLALALAFIFVLSSVAMFSKARQSYCEWSEVVASASLTVQPALGGGLEHHGDGGPNGQNDGDETILSRDLALNPGRLLDLTAPPASSKIRDGGDVQCMLDSETESKLGIEHVLI